MMNVQNLFTPISKKYCDYFYILSIIFFVLFVAAAIVGIMSLFDKKGMKLADVLILVTQPLILYFINFKIFLLFIYFNN